MMKNIFISVFLTVMILTVACTEGGGPDFTEAGGDKTPNGLNVVEHKIVLSKGVLGSENKKIVVKQGENVKLQFISDMEVEVHLHGYDLKLNVHSNEESTMQFMAGATGRFAITSHSDHQSDENHKFDNAHAELFESGALSNGDSFEFEITDSLSGMTILFHDHMSHGDSGEIMVSQHHKSTDTVEIRINESGFVPAEVMVGPGTNVKWISDKQSTVRVTSGALPVESHASHGNASHEKAKEKEPHNEKTLLVVEVRP